MEPCGELLGSGKNCPGFHANGISRWSAMGHWGLTRGVERYGLTRVRYPTKPGVAKEGECGPKEASQSS